MTKLLTVDETADWFRVSSKTIRNLIKRGDLDEQRIGRKLFIREEDGQTYLDSHCGTCEGEPAGDLAGASAPD